MAKSLFVKAEELQELLGISRSESYRIIKKLNDDLKEKGFIVLSGRVSRKYLEEMIYLCMIILACVNKATFIFLQAMGKAAASTMLSMVREIVFGVGFALLLPLFFGLDGVLYSMPASDVLTAIISAIIIAKTYKQLNRISTNSGNE